MQTRSPLPLRLPGSSHPEPDFGSLLELFKRAARETAAAIAAALRIAESRAREAQVRSAGSAAADSDRQTALRSLRSVLHEIGSEA